MNFWNLPENELACDRLIHSLKSPTGVIPFVGAGLSIPYGFVGWTDFIRTHARHAEVEIPVEECIRSGRYPEAASLIVDAIGRFHFRHLVESTYGRKGRHDATTVTAAMYLPFIARGPVITTNFDSVLEDVFRQRGSEFSSVVVGGNADRIRHAVGDDAHYLLKIHGDAMEEISRILTAEEYDNHYGDTPAGTAPVRPLPNLLFRLMTSRHLIFIGCSLSYDRTLDILALASAQNGSLDHFAVLRAPDDPSSLRERRKILGDRYHVWPIWIPRESSFEELPQFLAHIIERSGCAGPATTDLIRAARLGEWTVVDQIMRGSALLYPLESRDRSSVAIARGKQHMIADEADLAYLAFREATELDASNAEAWLLRALVQLMRGNTESAQQDVESALRTGGRVAQATAVYGLVSYDRGDIGAAQERFRAALQLEHGEPLALNFLLLTYLVDGEFEEASKLLAGIDAARIQPSLREGLELMKEHLVGDIPLWKKGIAWTVAAVATAAIPIMRRDMMRESVFELLTGIKVPSRFDQPAIDAPARNVVDQ